CLTSLVVFDHVIGFSGEIGSTLAGVDKNGFCIQTVLGPVEILTSY
ncbi:MAG: hypothetical protein ACI82A_003091, partial [Candidatus Azotimanducaceae bacterium]